MRVPADLRFRDLPYSGSVDAAVRRRLRRLDALFPQVLSWNVTMEHHPVAGHAVRLLAHLPGNTVAASRVLAPDLQACIREAFQDVECQLDHERSLARSRASQWLSAVRSRTASAGAAAAPH
jgi:hypothetical protein